MSWERDKFCTPLHASLVAMDLSRTLRWDPAKEGVVGDTEATRRTLREDLQRV